MRSAGEDDAVGYCPGPPPTPPGVREAWCSPRGEALPGREEAGGEEDPGRAGESA